MPFAALLACPYALSSSAQLEVRHATIELVLSYQHEPFRSTRNGGKSEQWHYSSWVGSMPSRSQKWLNSPIRMMIGIGMPRSNRRIERISCLLKSSDR